MDLPRQAQLELKRIFRRARAASVLKKKGPAQKAWRVEVSFVGVAAMTRLNAKYLKKKRPTDILSFPSPRVFFRQGILGELVICETVLKRQAREQKHSLQAELRVLLVHGALHLLGFDHEKSTRAAKIMRAWEAKLLGRASTKGLLARNASGIS